MAAARGAVRSAILEKEVSFESSGAHMAAWGAVWVATENADDAAWEGVDCVARIATFIAANKIVKKELGVTARGALHDDETTIKVWQTAWETAYETAYDVYIPEFKRLCQLEGVYGEVVT
jgi:predicted cobalt transporter CbtA